MRPVNIVLLVLAGALVGAVVMKVAQRPHRAEVGAEVAAVETSAPVTPAAVATPEPVLELPHWSNTPGSMSALVAPAVLPPVVFHAAPRSKPDATRALPVRHFVPSTPTLLAKLQPHPAVGPSPLAPLPLKPEQPQETPPARIEPENTTPVSAPIPTAPETPTVTLNAGKLIPARLVDNLSLERNHAGDRFAATLDRELEADGFVIAERGARVEGKVVTVDRSARTLSIELTTVETSDRQEVTIQTERNVTVAGTLSPETRVTFRLRAPVTITERRD
jgi:hypothetical protein